MAKDEPPGLLSKVVKFVRNPTTDWANLSEVDADREVTYSKQQLKEMIERKRRNDFVRRREFDQLRKLRSREPHSVQDQVERPSFFQSSLPSRPADDRAGTLKKIDEIEEQMSQQWWKTHKETGQPLVGGANPEVAGGAGVGAAYALTEAAGLDNVAPMDAVLPAGDLALEQGAWGATVAPAMSETTRLDGQSSTAGGTSDFGALGLVTGLDLNAPAFVHAPELEESAIRFANGDVAGAEKNLQDLLSGNGDAERIWSALFDLYRATGQHQKFEALALDYAVRFNRLAPLWFSFPAMLDALVVGASADRADQAGAGFRWVCPGAVGLGTVNSLVAQLDRAQQPWSLDWSGLKTLDISALDALADQFVRWSEGPVRLRFSGCEVLLELLRQKTPSGDTSVPPAWWRLRLEVLRMTGHSEAFDFAALEYCVTYEVSPPSWIEVQCHYASGDEAADVQATESYAGVAITDFMPTSVQDGTGMGTTQFPPLPMAELAGQLTGDASEALNALDSCVQDGMLLVACDKLARVDFSAAGSVLNWVAARQAEGCQVFFCNLHSLVAVFFNVIGINEYARVLPRQ